MSKKSRYSDISEIYMAFAQGKTIQSRFLDGSSDWINIDSLDYIDLRTYEYRVRPSSDFVALGREDLDERILKLQTLWIKEINGSKRCLIVKYNTINVTIYYENSPKTITYEELRKNWQWLNGCQIEKKG